MLRRRTTASMDWKVSARMRSTPKILARSSPTFRHARRQSCGSIGTSRGSISAVNAASRLSGPAAPAGVVLTSPVTVGQAGARKAWVAQSVFDLKLEAITVPLLVVGHAADNCIRSPAKLIGDITARTSSAREQVVTISGGPGNAATESPTDACEGRSPHGFVGQETEVVEGIARFVLAGKY